MASYRPPSAAVLLFEPRDIGELHAQQPVRELRLPFYIDPEADEALVSWLLRLTGRMQISVHVLARKAFTVDGSSASEQLLNPSPMLLSRISHATGVPIDRVRGMMYRGTHVTERDAEADGQRTDRSVRTDARWESTHHFVVCPRCLQQDATPYLRRHWMLNWTIACPVHASVLISRCTQCQTRLRLPPFAAPTRFSADRCTRCAAALQTASAPAVHERVMQLQTALLTSRQSGCAQLPGIGVVGWPEATAAAEVLLWMVHKEAQPTRRTRLYARVADDFGDHTVLATPPRWQREDRLVVLAWLLDRYPHNLRSAISILQTQKIHALIERFDLLDESTRSSLHQLFSGCDSHPGTNRHHWQRWLQQLPYTAAGMAERAQSERIKHRRIRLHAFAQLLSGQSIATVAAEANVTEHTLYRWLRQGAMEGLEAALERGCSTSALTDAQLSELAQWIAHRADRRIPRHPALKTHTIIEEAKSRFGVDISTHAARRLLRAHSLRRNRRRQLHRLRQLSPGNLAPVHDLST